MCTSQVHSTLNDGGYQLPNRVGSGALPSGQRSSQRWFDTDLDGDDAAFVIPALYQYGNSGLDILRGPGLATVDVSLARAFSVWENLKLQVRMDEFNLLNRVNFGLPNRILGVDEAGAISHTATPAPGAGLRAIAVVTFGTFDSMDYVNLGSAGVKVSRLCFGTMTYGSKKWREWVLEEEEAQPFYRRAIELGINFFDTADMYSVGV